MDGNVGMLDAGCEGNLCVRTLQFLHFHTKLASPREPDCAFCSCGAHEGQQVVEKCPE